MSAFFFDDRLVDLATGQDSDGRWRPLFVMVRHVLREDACSEDVKVKSRSLVVGCLQPPPRANAELAWAKGVLESHGVDHGNLTYDALKDHVDVEAVTRALSLVSCRPAFAENSEQWQPRLWLRAIAVWTTRSLDFNVIVLARNRRALEQSLHVVAALLHPFMEARPVPETLTSACGGCVMALSAHARDVSSWVGRHVYVEETMHEVRDHLRGSSGEATSSSPRSARISWECGLALGEFPADPVWMGACLVWRLPSRGGKVGVMLLCCKEQELLRRSFDILDAVCDNMASPPSRWEGFFEEPVTPSCETMASAYTCSEFAAWPQVIRVHYGGFVVVGFGSTRKHCQQTCRLALALQMLLGEPHLMQCVMRTVPSIAAFI